MPVNTRYTNSTRDVAISAGMNLWRIYGSADKLHPQLKQVKTRSRNNTSGDDVWLGVEKCIVLYGVYIYIKINIYMHTTHEICMATEIIKQCIAVMLRIPQNEPFHRRYTPLPSASHST